MSINSRLNQLYRRKVENIYNNPNLQIEEKYGVSNTHRTSGGFPNNTKYDIELSGGITRFKKPTAESRAKARKAYRLFKGTQRVWEQEAKKKEEFYKTPEGQKALLTQEVKKALLSKLDRQQKGAFLGDVDKWEKDPVGADILFGIVDFGKNIGRPILGLLNEIGKKVLPGAVGKIADIALGIGDSIMKGAQAQNQAFDIYRQLRKDKKINSFVNGSKRGYGKLEGGSSKRERRAQLVKKIMKEKGLNLPQASKYIKENNLQY